MHWKTGRGGASCTVLKTEGETSVSQATAASSVPSHAPNLLQFLGWVAARPRTYAQTMEAWRTSCPRLCAWEDAIDAGLVAVAAAGAASHGQASVRLTAEGLALLSHRTNDTARQGGAQ
jgi:hypothetical protein